MIHIKVTYSRADFLSQEKSQIISHTSQETIIPSTSQLPIFSRRKVFIQKLIAIAILMPPNQTGTREEFSMLNPDSPKPQPLSFQADVHRKGNKNNGPRLNSKGRLFGRGSAVPAGRAGDS